MCGIVGIATASSQRLSVDEHAFIAMRDAMSHRGPDDLGLWSNDHALLGHRRLSVIDPTPDGHQPMCSAPDGAGRSRFALVYNGELYNDNEIRTDLRSRGVHFRSSCDTETFLNAFAVWGVEAFWRVRGMFAGAFYDTSLNLLTLVRDPLGVKPLYYGLTESEIVFASEAKVVASHPAFDRRPDWRMVSAYLTTIRTALADRTMYEGVRTLRPGQMLQCDLSGERPSARVVDWWSGPRTEREGDRTLQEAATLVRATVEDAVVRQLRSDVPVCTLLSGGLDSSIITSIARHHHPKLRTYAAGAPGGEDDDLSHARRAAVAFGTDHAEATIDESYFASTWEAMVDRIGLPLSTPNEVAIYAVASRLRQDGCIVTLSGEGADEIFGGYDKPLHASWRYILGELNAPGPGAFELASNAWVPVESKEQVMRAEAWEIAERDGWLLDTYEQEFRVVTEEAGLAGDVHPTDRLQTHLRFLRRVNLAGLLQRLDSATMLASVEGRTPFADASVASLGEELALTLKYNPESEDPLRTKRVLRAAFMDVVPRHVLERQKASFPLPFTRWMEGQAEVVRSSALLRRVLDENVLELVAQQPSRVWNIAWPAINLAMWSRNVRIE